MQAQPYGSATTVPAISLRAREHVRLAKDACPSERYMSMLIQGAKELALEPSYIAALEAQPTQQPGAILRVLAINHLFFVSLLFQRRLMKVVRMYSWLLWRSHVPSTGHMVRRLAGDLATALVLLPGALVGVCIRAMLALTGKPLPPMLAAMTQTRRQDTRADADTRAV